MMKVVEERAPEFRAPEGLKQKHYLQDVASGEIAGLYRWETEEGLAAYRVSELGASIAEAYQAEGEPRVEVYKVLETLRDEHARAERLGFFFQISWAVSCRALPKRTVSVNDGCTAMQPASC